MKKPTVSRHEDAVLGRMIDAFLEADDYQQAPMFRRAAAIAALPAVEWKGRTLRTVRCRGDFGRGPHDVNVPESTLWTLIHIEAFLCPYHR